MHAGDAARLMSNVMTKRLMLIDGHALAFRAFHAMAQSNLRTSSGEPTYAVFGFFQILLTTLQEQRPEYLAVAFDVGRTFRHEAYSEYKAGRAETPDEFHAQLDRIKQVIQSLNIPMYTADGYEADDVIGTLARQATEQGVDTVVLTGDTDTLQLVNDHVQVLLANPYGQKTTMTLYDEDKVRERYKGLGPGQLADLRGLKGDASDNIPGVKGIGETGAMALLNQFGSVENLYAHLDAAPPRYRKHLDGQQEQAQFSKQLSIIDCNAPVTLDIQATELHDYDRSAVIAEFQALEFHSLVKKLPVPLAPAEVYAVPEPDAPAAAPEQESLPAVPVMPVLPASDGADGIQLALFDLPPAKEKPSAASFIAPPVPAAATMLGEYRSVTTEQELYALVRELTAAAGFAFDVESDGLDAIRSNVVGIALATRPGTGWYIPVGHREGRQLPRQHVLDALRPFLADASRRKFAHNAKFDMELLHRAGLEVQGLGFDTLLAARLLGRQHVGLKELAFSELKLPELMIAIGDLIGRGAKQITFDQVPIERAVPYAAADADMTLRLVAGLEGELTSNAGLHDIFMRMELPLVSVLMDMELAGIGLDVSYLHGLGMRLNERIAVLEQQVHAEAGEHFNINSVPQLNRILFEKLKLPTAGLGKTSTGRYSLTAEVLENLKDAHPIVQLILDYRRLAKLKSTYVDALPSLVNPKTGRVHTSYNQIGSATGRLSSQTPNLQNIPIRSAEGNEIRRAFVAAPGHRFLAADYSQIELRVLAHITQDPSLVEVFQKEQDIHAATAAQLFGVDMAQVDKQQRRLAKTVVFGVIYGISSFGLAQRTNLSRSEAQALIDALFARFPGIRTYIEMTLEQGRREGYVQSLFGRRRFMPELMSKGPRRQAAEREAVNAPIQATAADIMKLAMIRVARELKQRGLRTRMLLQVHDELILEAPHDELAEVQQMVREVMEQVYTLRVPLRVHVALGNNWEEMEEVE